MHISQDSSSTLKTQTTFLGEISYFKAGLRIQEVVKESLIQVFCVQDRASNLKHCRSQGQNCGVVTQRGSKLGCNQSFFVINQTSYDPGIDCVYFISVTIMVICLSESYIRICIQEKSSLSLFRSRKLIDQKSTFVLFQIMSNIIVCPQSLSSGARRTIWLRLHSHEGSQCLLDFQSYLQIISSVWLQRREKHYSTERKYKTLLLTT